MIGAGTQVLAWIAVLAVEGTAPGGTAVDSPNLQLASSYFQSGGDVTAHRNVLALALKAQTLPEEGFAWGFALGWLRLSQPGVGSPLVVSHVGNALGLGTYRFTAGRLDADAGVGVSLGLTASEPTPRRRVLRTALGHAIAMQGVYDVWMWAPGRAGFVLPARLHHLHPLGGWSGSARLEGAFVFTIPSSEEGESGFGRVVQAAAEYALLPRPWLAAGGRLQFVWMPGAELWKTQWSVVPFVAGVRGRWRLSADVLVNIDEPYGFAGRGQRIWAASLRLGAWL